LLAPEALAATLPGVPLGGLRIAYVRYRPGKNCLVAYRPALASSGETWIPASVHAVAWRRKLWDRARPARAAEATGIFLDDWAVSVSLYPDDAELPSLRLLVDADERPRALRSVLPDRPDFWSAPLGDLRHKPQQRYVGKLMPPGGPATRDRRPARPRRSCTARSRMCFHGAPARRRWPSSARWPSTSPRSVRTSAAGPRALPDGWSRTSPARRC